MQVHSSKVSLVLVNLSSRQELRLVIGPEQGAGRKMAPPFLVH